MRTTLRILQYEWKDLLRGKWVAGYGIFFLVLTDLLLRFAGSGANVLISLTNVILLFIPLAALIYGVLYLYQSREFVELLLAQPISRNSLYWGIYGGLSVPLTGAFLVGVALPLTWHGVWTSEALASALLVLGMGSLLTLLFIGLGFWLGFAFYEDRIKGFGFALIAWLVMAVLYDALVLLVIYVFGDYPLEKPVLAMSVLNPIDLARIVILLKFDISALMGYTGAVFSRFFGSAWGMVAALFCMGLWWSIPLWRGQRIFTKRDF